MATLKILVPDGTTNYVQNPSGRFDTTGWTVFGSTLTRDLTYARFGIASYKVVTTGATVRQGIYYRVNNLSGVKESVNVSAYVRGVGKVHIRLIASPGGREFLSPGLVLSPNRWKRIDVTGRCDGSNDVRLYVETDGNTAQAITFYVDGAQMERKPYATTYCDGDQPGCRWNIIQHASLSTRDPYTRQGGRWVTIGGPERESENLYMTVVGGLGTAPVVNHTQSFALAPGGYHQGVKVNERPITLTFHAKHKQILRTGKPVSLSALHQLRELLIDIVKPDKTGGDQPFLMEYQDGAYPVYIAATYDGGLEGEWDIRNQWVNEFPLRLLCVSPFLVEDDQEMATIDFQESFVVSGVAGRIDGVWDKLNYGVGSVSAGLSTDGAGGDFELGRKGEIYLDGPAIANYSVQAVDPMVPVGRITYWDGTKWNKLGSGVTGPTDVISDVAVAPNGNIYVTGLFSSIGGVAANNIAMWNGSVWAALGSGLNAAGVHVSVAPNGDVYVGGAFTTAGGVTRNRIAKWNGTAWSGIGQYNGMNEQVFSIAISPDGLSMYIAGRFTDQAGLSANAMKRVAYYDVATDRFSAVGSGFATGDGLEIIVSPFGVVYCCGSFILSGTTTVNYIAQLQGSAWIPLGSGMNTTVNSMDVAENGDLVAIGAFSTAGGIPVRGLALWNGSGWVAPDIVLGAGKPSITPLAVQFSGKDMYVGGTALSQTAGGTIYQSQVSGITLVNNIGSAEAAPFIYILGPGKLIWIENQTTGKRIFCNLDILSGEEVFIDFGAGTIKSTVRGSLYYGILPGSDFASFTLIPGVNKIATLMVNDVGASMVMGYTPTHWSADATQQGETF